MVAVATIALRLAEEKGAVGEGRLMCPWLEFLRSSGILKMTPLFKSRFIQQPVDH